MSWLMILLLILIGLWLLGLWFGHGANLSVYQHPVEPSASESFGRPSGPSAEHQQAAHKIQALSVPTGRMSRGQMVRMMRDLMEEVPRGRTFNATFVPVKIGGMVAEWVLAPGAVASRRVLYLHGGAFFAGSPNSHRTITSHFSTVTGAAVLAIEYRLTPENRRMDGIEDCRTAYRWMVENGPDGAAAAERVYISGDSAGGNLALMLAPWIRDTGLRAADAIIAMSPLVDSTYSGASIRTHVGTDVLLGPVFGKLLKMPRTLLYWMFVLENRMRPVNPLVSPIFSDLTGLPPILIQASEAEMLQDDAIRYVNKARASGTAARMQRWAGLLHVWQIFTPEVPEAVEAFDQIGAFIRSVESA